MYVDDNFFVGTDEAIKDTIEKLRSKGLILKVYDNLDDYLLCEIRFLDDDRMAWLGQPHLISKLQKKFGEQVKSLKTYKTPGMPNLHMI